MSAVLLRDIQMTPFGLSQHLVMTRPHDSDAIARRVVLGDIGGCGIGRPHA
jgi:hypothetical protein